MLHLQAQRNLEVFLKKTGVKNFLPGDVMSFVYPDHRLDLAFRFNSLMMTTSVSTQGRNDDAFLKLMVQAGKSRTVAVLRVYFIGQELGINAVMADNDSAEAWYRLYQSQRALIKYYLNLTL